MKKSYNDFRIHFASYKSKVDYNRPFLNDDTSQSVINKLGNVYEETIEITKSFLDIKTVDQIQSILSKKKVIDLYGVGTAYITALNFEQKMMSTPYFINLKHIPSDQNRQAMLSHKDTVAIIISYSGEEEEIKKIVNYIKQKEGTIIAVTSINDSYLRKHADYCLTICSKENLFSKISADYIMDIIFSLLFKNNYNINLIEKLERAKNIQNIEF